MLTTQDKQLITELLKSLRELKKRYIDCLDGILNRKRLYKGIHGVKRIKDDLQNMKESAIIKMKCFELKESLGVDEYV